MSKLPTSWGEFQRLQRLALLSLVSTMAFSAATLDAEEIAADFQHERWRQQILRQCQEIEPFTLPTCQLFANDLIEILQPHPRAVSSNCSPHQTAMADAPYEVTDVYLLNILQVDSLEQALAYFLINLRVESYRRQASTTGVAASIADLAHNAVSMATREPKKAQELWRDTFRLLALLTHNHSLESQLVGFNNASATAMAQINSPTIPAPVRPHYFGNYWRSEMARAIGRAYGLVETWQETRSPSDGGSKGAQVTITGENEVSGGERVDATIWRNETRLPQWHFWVGTFVGCELRAKGHDKNLLRLATNALQELLAPPSVDFLHQGMELAGSLCGL